jgi:formiminotetrahydrofolate cyclodeaminase
LRPGYIQPCKNKDFVDELASATPTPGGGSASAYSGAMAAALVCMVARLTIGKKKYVDIESKMWEIVNQANVLLEELKSAVKDDARSFDELLVAMRLPKDSEENIQKRDAEVLKATLNAARIPLSVCEKSLDVMRLAIDAANIGNLNALSDAGSAFSLARAAFNGASMNVQINLKTVEQADQKQPLLNKLVDLKTTLSGLEDQIKQVMELRGGIII